ncbi:palmitoyltransferase ZDHHC23-like [Acanthaster planci]|uniref:Palmitoyltransferase n=1 Tax=Acanthaster planci TaxID=133434 RepID=A0A8B7YGY1_ACAPL|nr:palmitoyltransferase ZDHHC23-like [Acanthaster planci]
MALPEEDDDSGPLCCCEYLNDKGEKGHLLALCCDCQELDQICDRLFKGKAIEKSNLIKIFQVGCDRVRIPTCFGAGARRLDQLMDTTALPPFVIVPLWMYVSSWHLIATMMSFLVVPIAVMMYYRLVLRHRRRTQFFMSWGLVSVFLIYGTFYFCVGSSIEVIQFSAVTVLFVFTLMAFFASKHGPGVVKKQTGASSATKNMFKVLPESTAVSDVAARVQRKRHASNEGDLNSVENGCLRQETTVIEMSNAIGGELQVCSEAANQGLDDWCDVCGLMRPERAGHCRICSHCVHRLDHHCVWIDSCVGAGNHRSFLLAALLFVMGGLWGGYLSLDHLCSLQLHQMPDCSAVYSDRRTALVFVSVIYTLFAVSCVLVLLLQQFHLITHNWTYRERKLASRSHRWAEALAERDAGFISNWRDFLLMKVETKAPDRATKLTVL